LRELRYAVSAGVGLFEHGDDEIAFLDAGVFLTVGVGLEFVIAPVVGAEVVGPLVESREEPSGPENSSL
jgi:hypothetical protein